MTRNKENSKNLKKKPVKYNRSVTGAEGSKIKFRIADKISVIQHNQKNKEICLEKIEYEDKDKPIEFRMSYYLTLENGRKMYGRFVTNVPSVDFKAIMKEAKSKGWL